MRKNWLVVVILAIGVACGSSPAHAIPSSVYTTGASALGCGSTVGGACPIGVDANGRILVVGTSANGVFAEDTAHVSGDKGQFVLAVANPGGATTLAASGDYVAIGTSVEGSVNTNLFMYNSALSAVRPEDQAAASGDAGVPIYQVLQSSLTADAASGDYGTLKGDLDGAQITRLTPAAQMWSACSSAATGTSDTAIKTAVASNRIYVTSLSCYNTATVASAINFKDGASTIYAGGISNSTLAGVAYYEHSLPVPLRGSVNTAFNFAMVTTSTNTVCCAAGYISPN